MKMHRQRALAGRCIAVTRPAGQVAGLAHAIRSEGGLPLVFPLIGIGPAPDVCALRAAIARLDVFDMAFFVSPNAVQYALDAVAETRSWPERLAVSAVGRGTQMALGVRGFKRVIAPQTEFDSEAVLALPEFSPAAVKGREIVIFRGDGGRELLGVRLSACGAVVTYVTCYHRFVPDTDPAVLMAPARAGKLDALLFTSSEGVRNLVTIVGQSCLTELQAIPAFVSHSRIAAEASTAGFSTIITSQPGDESIMNALRHYFD